MTRAKKIYDLMKQSRLYGDIIEETENKIGIEISWGDWKHDHLRLDFLMEENFNLKRIETETTEEDGGDCYSAIHYYYF